jgi:LuxR family maltose regulon positive regulatory protein
MRSVIQCVWTDFDDALESVKIAYDLCRNEKNISDKIMALLAYSYILYAHENKTEAVSKLTELENVLMKYKISPYLAANYIGWKIYLLLDSGRFDEANYFARENGLTPDVKISYENESSYIFYIRLFIAQGLLNEATQKLSEFYKIAKAEKRKEILVQLNILSAIICKKNSDHDEAVVYLMKAMELAADEGLLNYFLFDYELFHDCLNDIYKICSITKTNITGQFIKKLQSTLKNKERRKKKLAESELSIREIETLGLIAKDLSNQEIADLLFISLNTVKTHVKHILWKLDAEKRSQAVTKAKELGIL